MKNLNRIYLFLAIFIAIFAIGVSNTFAAGKGKMKGKEKANIVETAIAADDFTILVAALQATGLDAALANEDVQFTVFAPTDAAFAALGEETINALVADPETLSDILLYHVIAEEKVKANRVLKKDMRQMANGDSASFSNDGGPMINSSNIIVTDIITKNGVIHVIDAVLLPPAE